MTSTGMPVMPDALAVHMNRSVCVFHASKNAIAGFGMSSAGKPEATGIGQGKRIDEGAIPTKPYFH